jgi:putative two-component system response regulator
VYKPPMPHDQAVGIIREGRGTQFDAQVVDALLQCEIVFQQAGLMLHGDGEADPAEEESDGGSGRGGG